MDFARLPTVYIEHGGQTFPFLTVQSEQDFIFSLWLHFGKEYPPHDKRVILIGERDGPKEGQKEEIKAGLSTILQLKLDHKEPLRLNFADLPAFEGPRPGLNSSSIEQSQVATRQGNTVVSSTNSVPVAHGRRQKSTQVEKRPHSKQKERQRWKHYHDFKTK
jgi:hypothetical protein